MMRPAQSSRGSASAAMSAPPVLASASRSGTDCSRKNRNLLLRNLREFGKKNTKNEWVVAARK